MSTILTKPDIYIVGRQVIDNDAVGKFLSDEGTYWDTDTSNTAEMLPELAGRMCYMSFGDKAGRKENKKYLGHIIDVGHGSVLEHTVYNFIFSAISRSLTHELVRHRAGYGFSQLSQRYVDGSDARFVMPPAIQGDQELEAIVSEHIHTSVSVYEELTSKLADKMLEANSLIQVALSNGTIIDDEPSWMVGNGTTISGYDNLVSEVEKRGELFTFLKKKTIRERRKSAREAARCVLPNATETKIFVTANARSLRHFIELRGAMPADAEIRNLACELALLMKEEAPSIFGDYEVVISGDKRHVVSSKTKKV